MFGFTYYSPTEIVIGPETEALAGALVQKWGGSRVLVVCGGHSARASGLLDRLLQSLTQAGLAWSVLEGVRPNPLLSAARAGVKQASDFGADFLLDAKLKTANFLPALLVPILYQAGAHLFSLLFPGA